DQASFTDFPVTNFDGTNWTFNSIPQGKLASGTSYYATSQAQDSAVPPNSEAYFSIRGSTFSVDLVPPSAGITASSAATYSSLTTLSGTATDDFSGVGRVEIAIQDATVGFGQYYNFQTESFALGSSSFGVVTGTNPWRYTDTAGDMNTVFVSGHNYI